MTRSRGAHLWVLAASNHPPRTGQRCPRGSLKLWEVPSAHPYPSSLGSRNGLGWASKTVRAFPSPLPALGMPGGLLRVMNSAIKPASTFHRRASGTPNRKGQLQQAGTLRPLRVPIELPPLAVLHHERRLPLKNGIRTNPYPIESIFRFCPIEPRT